MKLMQRSMIAQDVGGTVQQIPIIGIIPKSQLSLKYENDNQLVKEVKYENIHCKTKINDV